MKTISKLTEMDLWYDISVKQKCVIMHNASINPFLSSVKKLPFDSSNHRWESFRCNLVVAGTKLIYKIENISPANKIKYFQFYSEVIFWREIYNNITIDQYICLIDSWQKVHSMHATEISNILQKIQSILGAKIRFLL